MCYASFGPERIFFSFFFQASNPVILWFNFVELIFFRKITIHGSHTLQWTTIQPNISQSQWWIIWITLAYLYATAWKNAIYTYTHNQNYLLIHDSKSRTKQRKHHIQIIWICKSGDAYVRRKPCQGSREYINLFGRRIMGGCWSPPEGILEATTQVGKGFKDGSVNRGLRMEVSTGRTKWVLQRAKRL